MSDFTIPVGTLDPNLSAMGRHVHLATDLPETGTNGYVLVSNGPDTPATFQPTGTAPPNAHVLATTAGLGSQHTTSGLTSGMVLRASGAAAAAFAFLIASDLPAHTHDASEIVTGVMLRARLPSQVAYTDVSNNFAAAQTVTGVLHVRSGASGTNGVFQIGRTSDEATLAAIASAGNYSTDSQVGDLVLRNEDSTKALRFLAGSGGSALVVKSVEVDVPTGPFVVGPDPSGTAIVRAGGQARFYTNTTYPGSEWAAPVISIIDTAGTGWLSNNFLALSLNGAAGQITVGRSRGTLASPSPMLVGDVLGALWGAGQYDTTVGHFVQSAGFRVFAAENWSATTLGSYITAVMTPPGGATSSNYFRWDYNAFYPLIAGGATLGLSANRWGKMWGQDADFNTSVVVGVDPGGSALVRIGGDLKVQVAGEPSLIARGTGTSAYEGGVLQLIASGVTTAAQQATWLLHNQNNLNTAQANFQIQQRQDDGTYVGTIGTYDYPTAAWSFYNAVNIPTGTLTIGAFNANHLVLLSGNSVYGWRLDTTDGGGGNVPLRLYRRTASVDTQVLNVRNEDGSFQVQAPVATQVATTVGWNAASSYMFGTGSTGTGFRGGFSHNIYWNGTNWILPADGANSGGSMVTMGIASNMEFFVVASAGVSSQTISNATMDSTHKRMILSTVALTPRGAGSMTLGTVSLPWGAMYGNTSLDITGGGLKFNVSDSGGHSALEHGRIDGTASTPFMDWHAGATAVDYDFRFIASTGTGVTAGGTMTFDGAIFKGNGATVLGASGTRWGKLWGQDASFSLDVTMDVLGTFDHTGTRFGTGTGPVADDVMSWHGSAQKWRPRFLQTQFTNGIVTAQNNTDGTFSNFAFAVTYNNLTPAVPAVPIITPVYGGFIVDMGALPPSGSSYVLDYKINAGSFTTNRIIFTSQKIVHTVLTQNGTAPFLSTDTFTYKAKGRGKADGTQDSAYSANSAATSYVVTTEVNAFGLILASQISAVYLSAITANVGSITAGQLVSGDGKSILQLDSTFSVPSTVTQGIFFASANPVPGSVTGMYIDFTPTTGHVNPIFHHSKIDLYADGSARFGGQVDIIDSQITYNLQSVHIALHAPGVAHGMTGYVPTDVHGVIGYVDPTKGGTTLIGFGTADHALDLQAYATTLNSSTQAAMYFSVGKKSGTIAAAIADTDLGWRWSNFGTSIMQLNGAGFLQVGYGGLKSGAGISIRQDVTPTRAALELVPGSLNSGAQSAMTVAQTWNTAGTPVLIDVLVTDTSSPAGSMFMKFRTGAGDMLTIRKDGSLDAFSDANGIVIGTTYSRLFLNVGGSHRPWKIAAQDATSEAFEIYRAQANNADARGATYDAFLSLLGANPSVRLGAGVFMEYQEISAPGTPPANVTRDYAKDVSGVSTRYWKDDGGTEHPHNLTLIDTQTFTATGAGTWTKPAGAVLVKVVVIGAGGGGGGGRGAAASTVRQGGTGGGGGASSERWYNAADLGSTESLSVGTGGTHGNGGSSADGANGTAGGDSWFGSATQGTAKQWAYGGGAGNLGSSATARSGGSGGGTMGAGINGNTASNVGGAPGLAGANPGDGGAGSTVDGSGAPSVRGGGSGGGGQAAGGIGNPGGASQFGGGGGGAGGGITVGNGFSAGGAGGDNDVGISGGGGASGVAGANGDNFRAGQGGGGATAPNGAGNTGGGGGVPGGGGGGGSGGVTTGGNGGDGGRGEIRVYSYA